MCTTLSGIVLNTYAATPSPQTIQQQQEQLIREQQRQQQLQQHMQPDVNVRLDGSKPPQNTKEQGLPQNEQPCFAIQEITLTGDSASRFQFALRQAIQRTGFQPGMCLGAMGVNQLMSLAQDAVIARGYTTTRILATPQDLRSGHLVLTVIPGRIHAFRYNMTNSDETHVGRITAFNNKFPAKVGDILNLRDLEQGLENLKRNPTAEADIQIEPADVPNESDVVISWKQRLIPWRVSINVDDSGNRATGKYQAGITIAGDNPLGLSDLFYVNYSQDLGTKDRLTDSTGKRTDSSTRSYALHYSFPLGNWLLAVNHNYYRYHQAVAGLTENYDYNGESSNTDFDVTRLLYRNAHRKINMTAKLWKRSSHNYINDAEVDTQRRRTAGWAVDINHKEYLGNATFNLDLGYKRGTGWGDSLRAPEEVFDEGTSRMQIITLDAGLYWPFAIAKQNFSYDTTVHSQWNKTPLVTQDQLSIGGRYTVRGFDGETTLMGEHGWYWQNTLGWGYRPGHQVYLGADIGHVAGPSTEYQLGQTLAGAVLGFKGQFKAGGQLYYDVFAGKPLIKPQYFKTARTTVGFSVNYAF